jgi:hypothetical protein
MTTNGGSGAGSSSWAITKRGEPDSRHASEIPSTNTPRLIRENHEPRFRFNNPIPISVCTFQKEK